MAGEIKKLSAFLSVPLGKIKADSESKALVLHDDNGHKVTGLVSVVKYLSKKSKMKDVLGRSAEDQAVVNQWLEYRVTRMEKAIQEKNYQVILKELDAYLSDRVYITGFYCTVADVVLFLGLYSIVMEMTFYEKQKHLHLSRWFDQVQHQPGILQNSKKIYFQRNLIYSPSSSH